MLAEARSSAQQGRADGTMRALTGSPAETAGTKKIKERSTHMKATRIAMNGSTGIGRRKKEDQSIPKNVLYVTIVIACAALFCAPLQASTTSSTSFNRPLVFEPNQGQFAPEAQWIAR